MTLGEKGVLGLLVASISTGMFQLVTGPWNEQNDQQVIDGTPLEKESVKDAGWSMVKSYYTDKYVSKTSEKKDVEVTWKAF